ncbi:2-succinyl-6-hydroxy-2,4-cyclohexadiene-1-carboxylate synthase [Shewanella livingstonensis]|uniref:Putative 2-succinyl-6-hydroxy-2,4-cyclohexadiene-1-carboxylate synthase n=1 Tax=Shewanella livingstonensis TaxID=150120 RepID=A0A3G8M279_9GAMM|nr:2-succinyl-6-hydroxy-2,4-cyclohexadiene-1-carboxylate synthase [Shewanella livingstonensis]AZG75028.1 2-succinyl-6-hydroxy-2,4-cyclohexadiene-1-carboxylate synthase [Shewanella livingstonensis]
MVIIRRFGQPQLPALLMLHGFLGSKDDWSILMPRLSQYFHCICIDLPGHGANEDTLDSPGLHQTAELIVSKVHSMGYMQFHLLGYSLGGRIALHIADSYANSLLSLTLESAHPGLQDAQQQAARAKSDNIWAKKLQHLPIANFLALWYQQAVFNDLNKTQKQQLIAIRRLNHPHRLANCYAATSLSLQQDCRTVLEQLDCPCHFIYGVNDNKFAQVAIEWQTTLADSGLATLQLHPLHAAGHNIHSLHPQLFTDTLLKLLWVDPLTSSEE